jgi:mono/diheme cytochrome c family protein
MSNFSTAAILLVAALSYSAVGQDAKPTAAAGEKVFLQRCFQCHSTAEGQVKFGPSLYGELKPPHPKKTPAEIRTILKEGKGKMPSFKDILTQEDTDNLIAYIHSL